MTISHVFAGQSADFCTFIGVPWYEFDWKTYVKKDIQDGDKKDPLNRFGIHLLNSVDLGVNRTIRRTR